MRKIESCVTRITWERIYMYVDITLDKKVEESDNVRFFLVNEGFVVETEFDVLEAKGSEFKLKLNVTNSGINRCVNNGIYTIVAYCEDSFISEAGYQGTSKQLEGWGRCFRYWSNSGAYTVTCLLDEYAEQSRLLILFFDTKKQNLKQMPSLPGAKPAKKESRIKRIAKNSLHRFSQKSYTMLSDLLHKKETNNLLFISEQTERLPLNMKAIYDRLIERELDKTYDIKISLSIPARKKEGFSARLQKVWDVAKADVIIVDDHVPLFDKLIINKKHTKVIQIWHAGAGFKGVGYSRWGHEGCPGPYCCHRQYDYCISGSKKIAGFFSEQFGILDEQIISTGMPRMDSYIDENNRNRITEELYQQYPMLKGKKVILFAPTYRGRNIQNAYYPYDRVNFDELHQFCVEKNYAVIFKMHPWVQEPAPVKEEHKDCFVDLNKYPNINDLFYITDLLITDYSSNIYEYSIMEKPMIFFAYDKEQYATSRGFHRDYDSSVPGRTYETFDEIMKTLWAEDFEPERAKKYREDHIDYVDVHSSDRIIDWLIMGNLPEEYKKALDDKKNRVRQTRGMTLKDYLFEE